MEADTKGFEMQMVDVATIKIRQNNIRNLVNEVMIKGLHYGDPFQGSDKLVLLKSGGEVLKVAFQLSDKCEVIAEKHEAGHITYTVHTRLYYMPSDKYVGIGIGSCSTLESRYRYRNVNEALEVGVSKDFWDLKNSDAYTNEELRSMDMQAQIENDLLADGEEYDENARYWITKNDSGQWVYSIKKKDENPDIADTYNTVLKMAKKRSELDAIINVTGCSHMFTQDVEEFPEYQDQLEKITKKQKSVGMNKAQLNTIKELTERMFGEVPQKEFQGIIKTIDEGKRISQAKSDKMIQWLKAYDNLSGVYFSDTQMDEITEELSDELEKALVMLNSPISKYKAKELVEQASTLEALLVEP